MCDVRVSSQHPCAQRGWELVGSPHERSTSGFLVAWGMEIGLLHGGQTEGVKVVQQQQRRREG